MTSTDVSAADAARVSAASTVRRAVGLLVAGAAVVTVVATELAPAPAAPMRPGAVRTVLVDPATCTAPPVPERTVVCTPSQAGPLLSDGATLVLAAGSHAGPLDLRGVADVVVRGEPGAVLDGGAGRYALSLRDVVRVRVEDLELRGGTAQTVWLEGGEDVQLLRVAVAAGNGSGVQVRDASGFRLSDSTVRGAGAAGVMELDGVERSTYERLVVADNGHGAAAYDGDGLQLAGTGVVVDDVQVSGNGSDPLHEHGVYVSERATDVVLRDVVSQDNAGTAVKLGGTGVVEDSTLLDDRVALYCAEGSEWTVAGTVLGTPTGQEEGCSLDEQP